MRKRVELIFNGNFDQGFSVGLTLGTETDFRTVEQWETLPAAPSLAQKYQQWQEAYRKMVRGRIQAIGVEVDGTPQNRKERCRNAWQDLVTLFQQWLKTEPFRPINDCLLQQLDPSDPIRVLIRSDNRLVHRLPWHEWWWLADYPLAEVALAATDAKRIPTPPHLDQLNILAVLGDSTNINTAVDIRILEQVPQATVVTLTDTTREELIQALHQQPCQMLFFAGHSETAVATSEHSDQGIIHLGENRSLTLDQLKYSLKGAIANGLQVAMFNSCDGLGLAYDLAPLQMPLIIIMREPVPDEVAQRFLQVFLQAFSQGRSLYGAVRRARERLEDEFEPDIPGVSGLPIIWQHPLMPLMEWPSAPVLSPEPDSNPETKDPESVPQGRIYRLLRAFVLIVVSSLCVSAGVIGMRYLGWLQPLELQAYDQISRLRPRDGLDSRILIVKITEEDIQPEAIQAPASISDANLEKLLDILFVANPRVVGLDIFRDFPVQSDYPRLANYFSQQTNPFVSICAVGDGDIEEIEPAPEASPGSVGFADIVDDGDRIHRRHLFQMSEQTGDCQATYALSAHLATRYLEQDGMSLSFDAQMDKWQLGQATFRGLEFHQGGYHQADMQGEQLLTRYRLAEGDDLLRPFQEVTLTEVLAGDVGPNLIRDRVVLIGTVARSLPDMKPTPYRTLNGTVLEIPGVILHAHLTSQLLDAALGDRPLLRVWHPLQDGLWIWGWAMVGGAIAWGCRRVEPFSLGVGVMVGSMWIICWWFLVVGAVWVPLVPAVLAGLGTTGLVRAIAKYRRWLIAPSNPNKAIPRM